MDLLGLALAGLLVGILVGLTGVGGGSVMTPLLITAFGIPVVTAVGTDLAAAAVTKSAGTLTHHRQSTVAPEVARLLMLGSVPAALAVLAFLAVVRLDASTLERFLRAAMVVAILISMGAVLLQYGLRRSPDVARAARPAPRWRPGVTVLAGAFIGGVVALTSLGAGALGAALLTLLYPELEPAEIAGTDIAQAVPLTVIAAGGHAWLGHVDGGLLLALLAGTVPGIVIGSTLVRGIPTWVLRTLLVVTLGVAAVKLS